MPESQPNQRNISLPDATIEQSMLPSSPEEAIFLLDTIYNAQKSDVQLSTTEKVNEQLHTLIHDPYEFTAIAYDAWAAPITRLVTGMLSKDKRIAEPAEVAQDITQDTFLKIMGYIEKGNMQLKRGNFLALYNTAASHLAIDYMRRSFLKSNVSIERPSQDDNDAAPLLVTDGFDVAAVVTGDNEQAMQRERAKYALLYLKEHTTAKAFPKYIRLLKLVGIDGLSYVDAAKELGENTNTVKMWQLRIRQIVRGAPTEDQLSDTTRKAL